MGGLLALATGFGNGYLDAKRQRQMDAERQTDRANRQQEFDAQMDEVKQAKKLRLSLADAATPATVNDNAAMLDVSGKPAVYEDPGVANSDYRQARTMGLADVQAPRQTAAVNGKAYGSTGEADAAAVAYNQPEAQQQRIGQAYAKAGQPMQAMQYQAAQQGLRAGQTYQQNAEFQLKKVQEERARQFQDEGAIDTAKMASTGNAQGVYDTFNAQGKVKLDAVPQVTQRDREIPGVGTVPTYDYEGSVTGPDGQSIPFKRNSHDMRMQTMPFEKQMEMMRKGGESESRANAALSLADSRSQNADTKAEMNTLREKMLDLKSSAGSGQPSREERLRYTSLFTDAGRRLAEAQKAKATLTGGANALMFNSALKRNPTGPEAQQLQDLDETIKSHRDERSLYQGMLAGSQTAPGLADARPSGAGVPSESAARAAVNSGGMGADPKAIARELAASEASLPMLKDAGSKTAMQAHIDDLKRQGASIGLSSATSSSPTASAGMTLVGKTPDGRMVYRTKDGKQVVGN